MNTTTDQFVVDASGNKSAVLIDIDRYEMLLEAREELDAIRAYDEAKMDNEPAIPFSQAIREIEESQL